MNDKKLSELTLAYCKAADFSWRILRGNDIDVVLDEIYSILQITPVPRKELVQKADLFESANRLDHAGVQGQSESSKDEELEENEETAENFVSISQGLSSSKQIVFLGEPGSGKSTTLQFIGYCCVHENLAKDLLGITEKVVPIRFDLRIFAEMLRSERVTLQLEEALANTINDFLRLDDINNAKELIISWRDSGQLFILLDGLDEISNNARQLIYNEISNFALSPVGANCRILITSRIAGYMSLGQPFLEFKIKPLEGDSEILPYITKWIKAYRKNLGKEDVSIQAKQIYQQLSEQKALSRLLDNPLILRLAVEHYCRTGNIARNRADLYTNYVDELWGRSIEKREIDSSKKDDLLRELEQLAWDLQTDANGSVSNYSLSLLREKMGILAQMGDKLTFSHATFQEYFVALRLSRAWKSNPKEAWNFLRLRLHISKWREPILLMSGLLDSKSSNDLLGKILTANSMFEEKLHRDIELAASIIGDGVIPQSEILDNLITIIKRLIKDPKKISIRRANLLIDVLVQIDNEKTTPLLGEMIKVDSLDVIEKAANGLGKIGETGIPYILRVIPEHTIYTFGYFDKALLDATKNVPARLFELAKNENPKIRGTAILALGHSKYREAPYVINNGLDDKENVVRLCALCALLDLDSPDPVDIERVKNLLVSDADPDIRHTAALIFMKMPIDPQQALPELLTALHDVDSRVRSCAIKSLHGLKSDEVMDGYYSIFGDYRVSLDLEEIYKEIGMTAIPWLVRALSHELVRARQDAAEILGSMGYHQAIPALIEALQKEEDGLTRNVILNSLGKLDAVDAIPTMINGIESQKLYYGLVLDSIENMRNPKLIEVLLNNLDSENTLVQDVVVGALIRHGNQEIVFKLSKYLYSDNENVRRSVIRILSGLKASVINRDLIKIAGNPSEDNYTRENAIEALGRVKSTEAIPILIRLLKDPNEKNMQSYVIRALGDIGAVEAIPDICEFLLNESKYIRGNAAEALGKIKSPQSVIALRKALAFCLEQTEGENYSPDIAQIIDALVELRDKDSITNIIRALHSESVHSRQVALFALGKLGAVTAVSDISKYLEEDDYFIQRAAIEALKLIGTPEALKALSRMADLSKFEKFEHSSLGMDAEASRATVSTDENLEYLCDAVENTKLYMHGKAVKPLRRLIREFVKRAYADQFEMKKSIKKMKFIVDKLADGYDHWNIAGYAAEQVSILQASVSLYQDPFNNSRAAEVVAKMKRIYIAIGIMISTILLITLTLVYNILTSALQENLKNNFATWIGNNFGFAFAILIILGLLVAIVTWIVNRAQKQFE